MLRQISLRLWPSTGRSISMRILPRQSLKTAFSCSDRCRASRDEYEKNEYCFISCASDVPRSRSGWNSSPSTLGLTPGLKLTRTTWPGAKLVTVPSW